MVDSLLPLPPINVRVSKTRVSEKNPHYQNKQQSKEDPEEEEIKDEIDIASISKEAEQPSKPKKFQLSGLQPNIDVEV